MVNNLNQGVRDWGIQRLTAIFMAGYSVSLLVYIYCHQPISYEKWHYLLAGLWVKSATILFIVSMIWHAWIGMWTVMTDYIKSFFLRAILMIGVLFMLLMCLITSISLMWGL